MKKVTYTVSRRLHLLTYATLATVARGVRRTPVYEEVQVNLRPRIDLLFRGFLEVPDEKR